VKRVAKEDPVVRYGSRRPGDPPKLIASFAKAEQELGWRPQQSQIDFIIETALRWHDRHPPATNDPAQNAKA
jgi:UDP-arabinose 4-epimerase